MTAYYTADIPLWHSCLPDDVPAWKQEWLGTDGAGEVAKEIGAWIVGFEKEVPGTKGFGEVRAILQAAYEVVRHYLGEADPYHEADPPLLLAIGLPGSGTGLEVNGEDWDELCRECGGWEYIDGCIGTKGKSNMYGGTFHTI